MYLRKHTILFDSHGKFKRLLDYKPMGALSYSREDLLQDTALANYQGIDPSKDHVIKIDGNLTSVIDNGDSLKIYDHWPKQKFIFARSTTTTFDIIYGY